MIIKGETVVTPIPDPLPIKKGGTDATTANGASAKILGDMGESTLTVNDDSMLVFKYSNPSKENGAVFYKKAPLVATYVKKKIGEALTPGTVVICNSSGVLTSSSNVDTGELGTLNGIDTSTTVQAQLDGKQDAITELSKSKVMICNSSGVITTSSTVTTTELNYLGGVTSKIQTQLNGKIGKFTLVWSNESPGSAFAKQNISVNYSNYTHLLYVFRGSTSANGAFYDSTLVPASIQTNLHTMVEYLPGFRSVTPASNTVLSFGEGHILNGTAQQSNNNYIIPYRIYGCNLV